MMPIRGIFNTINIEELKPELGFSPRQQEFIENSVEAMLFGEITGDLMQIIEAICTTETQAEAVKKLVKNSLRQRNAWFKQMLAKWVNVSGAKVRPKPLARWQNEVMTGQQNRLWVETERCSGKTTTAVMASLLRRTLIVEYNKGFCEDLESFYRDVEATTFDGLKNTPLEQYKQIIIEDSDGDIGWLLQNYKGRIVVLRTREADAPNLDKGYSLDNWETIKD